MCGLPRRMRNKIGKLDVATGQINEYAVPTPNSQPWDVAIGDDGSIWFTEQAADKIGRLDPNTGEIIEYPLSEGAGPTGIDSRGTMSGSLTPVPIGLAG